MNQNEQISVSIIADNRMLCEKFGAVFGKRIFKAEKNQVKLDYLEHKHKIEESHGITTNRPIFRYSIIPIDITKIELSRDLDESIEVVINRGLVGADGKSIEVHCPLDNPILTHKVTSEVVIDALNGKTSSPTFFASSEALEAEINRQNEKERGRVAALIEDLKKQQSAIETTMNANTNMVSDYRRQLNVEATKDIHVTIEA